MISIYYENSGIIRSIGFDTDQERNIIEQCRDHNFKMDYKKLKELLTPQGTHRYKITIQL